MFILVQTDKNQYHTIRTNQLRNK